ncbi:Ubiquitin-like domain-containing protein [Drosera capensis]
MSSGASDILMEEMATDSGASIEIKIKTMDSQTYTMQVDKQMPVPALKQQIASMTGIVTEHQRLICRGKVLKDDQLLSAYHVEDGHTLHLVVRDPASVPPVNLPNDPAPGSASNNHGQYYQVAPGIVVETLNVPGQGDRAIPNIGRIVSAILGSMSAASPSTSVEATEAAVIPDAVTTLSEFLNHMRREVSTSVRENGNNADAEREPSPVSLSTSMLGLPTPSSLAQLLLSTRQMLNQQTGDCLEQLAAELENQSNVVDPDARSSTQSMAWRTGVLLQNLGAYLLELGRTTMTVRLGRAPSEAVVNAGPAVFISPSGPNPIMVQPLPFQPGASFSTPQGNLQSSSSLPSGLGFEAGGFRRLVDIQIRRSPVMPEQGSDGSQQLVGQNSSSTVINRDLAENQAVVASTARLRGATVRVVPIRTIVAAMPDLNGPYTPAENMPNVFQPGPQATPESAAQQLNVEGSTVTGERDEIPTRTIEIDILSSRDLQHNQTADGQITSGVLQLLRGLFHVENGSPQSTAAEPSSAEEHGRTERDNAQEEEPTATEEGIFFSRMLQQIMPLISSDARQTGTSPGQYEAGASELRDGSDSLMAESSGSGTSRHDADLEAEAPSPKRQKVGFLSQFALFILLFGCNMKPAAVVL